MEQANGTPKARPHLKFANSRYAPSTDGNKRFGTPRPMRQSRPLEHDAFPSSNLNQSSINTARNIFRASSLSASTGPRFEPSIPRNTPHKVFAPAATPEPKRLFRDSTTKATPRRTLAAASSTELFKMAIPEPPVELTGAELAKKVPEDLNQQLGSVFADQYLEHLCPKDFDHLQRRQFFCVLDLRRLKHAANEIFAKKDWKLNIMNFAKEFEKSRSLILLRYGLYEFRNVKPSADILKKWRAAHGLEDEEQEGRDSPSVRPPKSATKRKADGDLDAAEDRDVRQTAGKRRAVDGEAPAADFAEFSYKNKRKAALGGDAQPTKQQKTATSATKAFLERITSTPTTPTVADITASAPPKPQFGATRDAGLARSVLNKNATGGSIFSYLSDTSKNSGVDADGESETESEPEPASQQKNGAVDAPAASAPSQAAINPFASKAPSASGPDTTASSSSEVQESASGRSLFDRVTKGSDGQPVRFGPGGEDSQAETTADTASVPSQPATADTPANKTWTPGTPLKFAPQPTLGSSLFGNASTPTSSALSTAAQPVSSIFGAQKPAKAPEESTQQTVGDASQSGEESDKENVSQPTSKLFAPSDTPKPSNGIPQPSATSLFKPASAGSETKVDSAKGAGGFGSQKPSDAASVFGNKSQPSAPFGNSAPTAPSSTPVAQSSILFGSKPAGDAAAAASDAPKATSLFAAPSTTPAQPSTEVSKATSNLFGNAGAASTEAPKTSSLFGPTAQAATSNLFGASSTGNALFGSSSSAKPASTSTSIAPSFSFGSGLGADATPQGSETPKAQPKFGSAAPSTMFGSPMKQDDGASTQKRGLGDAMQEDQPSPVKKPFGTTAPPTFFGGPQTSGAGSNGAAAFSFGSQQDTPSTSAPSMFGTNTPSAGPVNFNFGGTPGPATNFSASFGGTSSTPAPSGGMFSFGAASGPAQQPGSQSFTFGENTSNAAPPPAPMASGGNQDASNMFAFNPSSNTSRATTPSGRVIKKPNFGASKAKATSRGGFGGTPAPQTPMFGANQGGNTAPTFNISAPSPQPQGQPQNMFGANAGQQTGAMFGGASTSGTNSPFNNLGGASSLATTPEPGTDADAAGSGTAKPGAAAAAAAAGSASGVAADGDTETVHKQINLVDGGPGEEDETVIHDVRAKVMRFEAPDQGSDGEEKKAKSPWSTKGVGPLRILKHKTTGSVRVLLRREPTGHVALNRAVLPSASHKAEEKYVRMMTSDDSGAGLETWMIQVKTKELAKELAEALEKHKEANRK